jgi:hypothetical protein
LDHMSHRCRVGIKCLKVAVIDHVVVTHTAQMCSLKSQPALQTLSARAGFLIPFC